MTNQISPLDRPVDQGAGSRRFKTTLLVMTLNEVEGMKQIMPQVERIWVDQILVLDGGSTDGTVEWAREQGYEVYIQKAPGFRSAYLEVWPLIRGEIVVYFTPDGNSIPETIPHLLDKIDEGFELVIASRYLKGAHSDDDDLVTSFGNWMFRTLTNLLLRRGSSVRMTDPMVMLRALRKDLPHRLGLDRPEPFERFERFFRTRVDWIPLMSWRAIKEGVRWCEIPADEPPRVGGERKLKIFQWGAVYLAQLLGEAFTPGPGRSIRER